MNSSDKKYFKLIIYSYYRKRLSDYEVAKVENAFKYFNSNTINFIIEAKFGLDERTIKYIQEHAPEKLSRSSINNRIDMFLDQLRYEFK